MSYEPISDATALSAPMCLEEEPYGSQGGGKPMWPEPGSSATGFLLKRRNTVGKASPHNQRRMEHTEPWDFRRSGSSS